MMLMLACHTPRSVICSLSSHGWASAAAHRAVEDAGGKVLEVPARDLCSAQCTQHSPSSLVSFPGRVDEARDSADSYLPAITARVT